MIQFYTSTKHVRIVFKQHGILKSIGSWLVPRFYLLPTWSFTKDWFYGEIHFGFWYVQIRMQESHRV